MVFEGELVIVLNNPESPEECIHFARTVFEFPESTLVICGAPPSMKKPVEEVNKIAREYGRSVLTAPDWAAAVEMFRPEKVFFFNHKVKRNLEGGKIAEPLKGDKTVAIVFGTAPMKGMEAIGLKTQLTLPTAVGITLYLVGEALNPAGPSMI